MAPGAQVPEVKLKPLPINRPALGCDWVPSETKIARIDPGTQPCPEPACGVTAAVGVVEATTDKAAELRALVSVDSVPVSPNDAAARAPAVAAGAFVEEELADPPAAVPAGAVRRVELPERCVLEACEVPVLFDDAALPEVSAPAIPRPCGPANANPATNVAAPNRVVSRAVRRVFAGVRELDIGSPDEVGGSECGEINSGVGFCPHSRAISR